MLCGGLKPRYDKQCGIGLIGRYRSRGDCSRHAINRVFSVQNLLYKQPPLPLLDTCNYKAGATRLPACTIPPLICTAGECKSSFFCGLPSFPIPSKKTKLTAQDRPSNMPSLDRSPWRDTYIYASDNRTTVLGGLWVAEGVTNANLYSMLEVFCFFTDTFDLHDCNNQLVERDEQQLQPGNYYIFTDGKFLLYFHH